MASIEYNIYEIDTNELDGFRTLTSEDTKLLTSAEITKTFKPNDNFIELSFYTLSNTRLQTIGNYGNYSVLSGDNDGSNEGSSEIAIDPKQDYISYGFDGQEVKAVYNFLDYPYSNSSIPQDFYIESISPDRTEIRVVSVNLGSNGVLETTKQLIDSFANDIYTPDLYVYFGNNIFYSIVNIDTEEFRETNAVLLKLYKPLPSAVNLKTRFNIVEKVSDSVAFEINTVVTPDEPIIPTLRSANFNIEVDEQSNEPSQYYNYTELFSFPTNNSNRELNSLFDEKGAELGIDYSEYGNFINFSSAEERIRNFKYKLDLINSYQSSLDNIEQASVAYDNVGISGSRVYYENLLNGVVNNFDHYEKHLYFQSGSTSWPKSNSLKPFINLESSNTEATNWYTSELQDAILYDAQNPDILTNSIPAYLKEDQNNEPYNLLINMIAQHFDNIWIYTDAVSNKYNADNRLDRGVSKDLIEELLKNFGIKLYTSNKSVEDLFRYFTVNSYDSSEEQLPNGITLSGALPSSQKDYQKEIYKRIYHNLPLLFKSKGTERGLRALINCFGIPSDILKIKVYGGQSVEDLPFFGGEQAWTGSLDKIRLDNTGSIVPGDTVSFYTSIINEDNKYTQDLHRIEIGFSPADNINSYIISQSAVLFPDDPFNIDNYIGDPRNTETNVYTSLRTYADQIFDNVGFYDVKDFVRLIKFFDNVIFRMVRDFVPARSVTDSGIIIKPHLLERSKHISPVMTWTRPEYSGSIDTAFIEGDHGNTFNSGSEEYSTAYSASVMTPTGRVFKKWTPLTGNPVYARFAEEAKFDGELSGSLITVSTGELNDENPFKELTYKDIFYNIGFYKTIPSGVCIIEPRSIISSTLEYTATVASLFTNISGEFDFSSEDPEVEINEPNISIDFTEQYSSVEVTAIKEDDDECTATSIITAVVCNVTLNEGADQIQVGQPFDLSSLFIINDNTDFSILIDNEVIDNYEDYVFIDTVPAGITFRDNVSEGCTLTFNTAVNACTLLPPITDNRFWNVFQQNKYPNLFPNTPENPNQVMWGGDEYFSLLEIFPGSDASTVFQIQMSIQAQGDIDSGIWLECPVHDLGTPGSRYFPTNFKRLAEDYQFFNTFYNPTVNQGTGEVSEARLTVYFRAVQNDECIRGYLSESQGDVVQWNPGQDQVGLETGVQWNGPMALNSKFKNFGTVVPGYNSAIDSNQDFIPDIYDSNDIDDNLSNGSPHDVCKPINQGGGLSNRTEDADIFGRLEWDLPSQAEFNQNETRSSLFYMMNSQEPLFTDPRGFNPIDNGVYTDYRQRTTGTGQDTQPFMIWAGYDYFFRPSEEGSTGPDPYVSAKRYRAIYQQAQLYICSFTNPGG